MTEAVSPATFERALRDAYARFQMDENAIRANHANALATGKLLEPIDDESLLERPTRRFLIDPMLRALGWDPDDPDQVTEEARSWDENGDRLYFDYLGINRLRAPTLIVEAKGLDSVAVRPPRAPGLNSADMSKHISEALGVIKAGGKRSNVLVQWKAWLADLQIYVSSLGSNERAALRRLVISSGEWLIVFKDPITAFIVDGAPPPEDIYCFVSREAIVAGHYDLYRLLARPYLLDTLPVTMNLGEALAVLEPSALTAAYRGVVVSTRIAGGAKSEFPLRVVYPALVLVSGNRAFGVVDYVPNPVDEPRAAEKLDDFLVALRAQGDSFQQRVLTCFNRLDLNITAADHFPADIREPEPSLALGPEADSTAAMVPAPPILPQLVRRTGERGAENEFLVITGTEWFYKNATPTGAPCEFHAYLVARRRGVAGKPGRFDYTADSFTVSGDDQHCAHNDLLGLRQPRCFLLKIEIAMCCRTCAFHSLCWPLVELPRLPCGT